MLDDAGISRWLSVLPGEDGRGRRLLENGQARRCVRCHRPIDIQNLDLDGKCPDCGGTFGWILQFPRSLPGKTPEPEPVNEGVEVLLVVLISTLVVSAMVITLVYRQIG